MMGKLNEQLQRMHKIVKFRFDRDGAKKAHEYLKKMDRLKDFWFHVSTFDMVNHANKIYNENEVK
jgi:hypothetical protein